MDIRYNDLKKVYSLKINQGDIQNTLYQGGLMIIVTGDGRIVKDLDKEGVIRELQAAQKRGDKYCSVTGIIPPGLDQFDLEREAGYNIGATARQCERSLEK